MGKRKLDETVRLSSKGQIVIPARIRRELGLKTGRVMLVTTKSPRQIVLSLPEDNGESLESMLKRSRAWKSPVDEVEELHKMRQRERVREALNRERRGY